MNGAPTTQPVMAELCKPPSGRDEKNSDVCDTSTHVDCMNGARKTPQVGTASVREATTAQEDAASDVRRCSTDEVKAGQVQRKPGLHGAVVLSLVLVTSRRCWCWCRCRCWC